MPKTNTLLSYFTKKPKSETGSGSSNAESEVLSPKKGKNSPGKDAKSGTPHSKQNGGPAKTGVNGTPKESCRYEPGDLVWAKLDGYPWWPGMVCNHPTQKKYLKEGKRIHVHVQFFDDPVSRAWVLQKNIQDFKGSQSNDFQVRGGKFYTSDPTCRSCAEEADAAMDQSKEERLELVKYLPSSDESEEDEPMEVEKIAFDADIFDDEASDLDNSKENHQEAENGGGDSKKSPKKTPSKGTPKKSPRSKRPSRQAKTKRRKIVVEDSGEDDSEDEFKPKKSDDEGDSDESGSSGEDEEAISDLETESEIDTPVKNSRKRKRGSSSVAPPSPVAGARGPSTANKKSAAAKKKLSSFVVDKSGSESETEAKPPKVEKREKKSESGDESTKEEKKKLPEEKNEDKVKKLELKSASSTSSPERKKSFTPSVGNKTLSRLSNFSAPETAAGPVVGEEGEVYTHFKLDFLKPDKIKDGKGHPRNHEDYDPRTLHVPDSYRNSVTPGMKQWWEIKSKHYDTVLFFKIGKFYELYHMDAVIGVNDLGLIYMKGAFAHSGFPEIAYGRYADTLVQKGYKVARVEQTETPEMAKERSAKTGKASKTVKREVCRITTKATKTYSFLDGDSSDSRSNYLLAIAEKPHDESAGGGSDYGVCFVDTSVGQFFVGQFEDDRHCSRLRTLVAQYTPSQVLFERGKLTPKCQLVLDNNLSSAIKEPLVPGREFWDSSKTLKHLTEADYFLDDENEEAGVKLPDVLKKMVSDSDSLGHTSAEGYELALSALGGATWYLKECLIDQELLSMKNFKEYTPLDDTTVSKNAKTATFLEGRSHMVLDSVTLMNLEVLENATDGSTEGTLLERLDQCSTPFGKRLLKHWICAPLCNPSGINDRLDAVDDLVGSPEVMAEVTQILKKLPDLERLLSKIHTLGSATRNTNHPDGRAIMYEDVAYSKRKIEDFLSVLGGFQTAVKIADKFQDVATKFKSKLLKQTVLVNSEDKKSYKFPDLTEELDFFDKAFDHSKARSDGKIMPTKGVDLEFDNATATIKSTMAELDDYLNKQKKKLGCRNIVFWGTGKNRFQMEIPESVARDVPDEFELKSQKKGYKRYWTEVIEELLNQMIAAEDQRDAALRDVMRRIFHKFDESYKKWIAAVQCLSVLDVLLTLAQYSRCGDGALCRPEFVLPNEDSEPFLEIREARHPCITKTFSGDDFIPNDTVIGIKDDAADDDDDDDGEDHTHSKMVLVTGPNMGGKSTLMRQVGLVVVMAQLGCYVPAEKCRLTPADRVFTRLGASDRIMAGESTFFVELSETSSILKHSTRHSLVLLDELGRGTATYDGTAIACAVVQELSQNVRCRTLFSTHYHSLVEEFSHDPNIRLGHMACMVENENDEDPSQETITFLYKFVKGACPKSYGFNAARLANLPEEVIRVGQAKARQFETTMENLKVFRILTGENPSFDQLKQQQRVICVQ